MRFGILSEAVEKIAQVLPRLDVLVIGPGLGRDASVQEIVRQVIGQARDADLPLILDGDALYFVSLRPDTVKGYTKAILTPNAVSAVKTLSGVCNLCNDETGDASQMEYVRLCATTRLVADVDVAKAATIPPARLSKA